jgi:hypothetical protein
MPPRPRAEQTLLGRRLREYGDRTVILFLGLAHERHAVAAQALVIAPEIIRIQEQEDAATRLVANKRLLFGFRCFRQQQRGAGSAVVDE